MASWKEYWAAVEVRVEAFEALQAAEGAFEYPPNPKLAPPSGPVQRIGSQEDFNRLEKATQEWWDALKVEHMAWDAVGE